MKALIWIGCCGAASIVSMCFGGLGMLGAIPGGILFGGAVWLAYKLCNKLDWSRAMEKVAESGMTITDYAKQGLTEDFLQSLPRLTYEKMKSTLKEKVVKGEITEAQCTILLKLYSWTPGKDQYPEV
jgi:hypothetical protein